MRRLFNKEKTSNFYSIINKFMKKNGFYIVLFLCVVAVGITAILVTKNNIEYYSDKDVIDNQFADESDFIKNDFDTQDKHTPVIAEKDIDRQNNIDNKNTNTEKHENDQNEQKINKDIKEQKNLPIEHNIKPSSNNSTKKITQLLSPVTGKIILDFAKDSLIYSKTLEKWCTHNGVDIRGDRGTPVKAAEDGIIEKVYKDERLGITIIINHGNGFKTKYCNLSSDTMVSEKQKINKGEIISGIGDTALFEIGSEPHLHFEVIEDEINVDPKKYLPELIRK